jgi:hypothetical protein
VSYKDDRPSVDEPDYEGSDDRFLRYKLWERYKGREPQSWGDWLAAGQPLAVEAEADEWIGEYLASRRDAGEGSR